MFFGCSKAISGTSLSGLMPSILLCPQRKITGSHEESGCCRLSTFMGRFEDDGNSPVKLRKQPPSLTGPWSIFETDLSMLTGILKAAGSLQIVWLVPGSCMQSSYQKELNIKPLVYEHQKNMGQFQCTGFRADH